MKLSYEAVERLTGSGRYSLVENEDSVVLIYYPPTAEEASGLPSETLRTLEIRLKRGQSEYEILGAQVKENGRVVKDVTPQELELWLQFVEG
ncbi:MAG: hypothetical protein RXS23_08475 [Metallosphaera yellowstonensis]|jgi:hypothetical protein